MRTRRRGAVSALIALCGIAIAVGANLSWISARGARPASGITHTSVTGLTSWSYLYTSSFVRSFGFAIAIAGVLVFIGGVVASRLLAGLFSLITLAGAGLWIGLNANHYSSVNLPYADLRLGAWLTIRGGAIGLISTVFLRHR